MSVRSVCVFCGSRSGTHPEYTEAARLVGTELARHGLTLVYGGASVGLMGTVASATLAAGGRVVGVLPDFMGAREIAHLGLTEFIRVKSMHERKALMAERSDAFIALPGGFGTLDELFEIITWAQLGLHRKPMGLLDTLGFYQPLVAMARHLAGEGFVPAEQALPFAVSDSPAALVERLLQGPTLAATEKWLKRPEQT
ncbi:TIGR00730 family Rossman fold protein [Myxococcus sp. K15C18031901]|uniref:LOG family protein n=1 Tax=Myxococcus dinghuensis TaxID=2906761 RepID=UPI0020A6E50B|nr:TIGR00730 family Rossman fold protein [Myxococcus dinghuensis]MCP3098549.1 TIGR00730 family Rossman fold protein [Myxococcus dinghuensis]